jgi:ubiquinone/menaquinone biosynthesis C-methylase UbiE
VKTLDQLKAKSEELFAACRKEAETRPWAVVFAMHEYYRNLYPDDSYIPFKKNQDPTERLYDATEGCLSFLAGAGYLGAYEISFKQMNYDKFLHMDTAVKDKPERVGRVYGKIWQTFSRQHLFEKAAEILSDRLEANRFDLSYFKGKRALDAGCGSGRYSFALKKLGCESVVGIDRSDEGLAIAKRTLKERGAKGVRFVKGDVLNMNKFENGSFDFLFSNGVLHRTDDMAGGVAEMLRVTKPGGKIWFYIAGDGGIFWYARKRMPGIMKGIPQPYAMKVLELAGLPGNRFIFVDNWYVGIEHHTSDADARKMFRKCGIKQITRLEKGGRSTDLDYAAIHGGEAGKIMWGDGELRYLLEKG